MIIKKDSGSASKYASLMLIVPTNEVMQSHRSFNRIAIENFDGYELVFRFELIDGGSFTLKQSDFEACLERMTSSEFIEYCETVNATYNALIELNDQTDTVESFVMGESNYWDDERSAFCIVQDLLYASETYNNFNNHRYDLKNQIIDDWGHGEWVETCRVYECLFNIERANI